MGCIPVRCFGSVILIHSQTYTADIHRGTHTCRHTQKHWQNPSAAGSQVGTIPPSPTSFQDRQTESNTRHPHSHWHPRWCSGDTHAPTRPCLCNSHICTGAACCRLSWPQEPIQLSRRFYEHCFGGKDSATASLWSDTGRRKDEGKRTLLTRKVLALSPAERKDTALAAFSVAQGLVIFLSSLRAQ